MPDLSFDDEEMFDTDFSEDGSLFLGCSSQRIHIWETPSADSEKLSASEPPEPSQVIQSPVLSKSLKCTFRAARFGRGKTASRLFTIVNATSHTTAGASRKAKRSIERKAFITTWDTSSWNLIKTRTVAKKPVTSFDVSPDGKLLALGGADLSVSLFDADSIRVRCIQKSARPPLTLPPASVVDTGSSRLPIYLSPLLARFPNTRLWQRGQYAACDYGRSSAPPGAASRLTTRLDHAASPAHRSPGADVRRRAGGGDCEEASARLVWG